MKTEQIIWSGTHNGESVEVVFMPSESLRMSVDLRVSGRRIAGGASLNGVDSMTRYTFIPRNEIDDINAAIDAARKTAEDAGVVSAPAATIDRSKPRRVNPATTWVGQASMNAEDSIF
jgi:hypothetical protein